MTTIELVRIKTIARAISKVHVENGIIQLYRYGLYVPHKVIPTKTLKIIDIKKYHPGHYLTMFLFHENTEISVTWPYRDTNTKDANWEEETIDLINKMITDWRTTQ